MNMELPIISEAEIEALMELAQGPLPRSESISTMIRGPQSGIRGSGCQRVVSARNAPIETHQQEQTRALL